MAADSPLELDEPRCGPEEVGGPSVMGGCLSSMPGLGPGTPCSSPRSVLQDSTNLPPLSPEGPRARLRPVVVSSGGRNKHTDGGLNHRRLWSHSTEAGRPRSRRLRGRFLLRPLP